MTETLTPDLELAESWAKHLTELDPEARERAVAFARQFVTANMPEDQLPPAEERPPLRTLGEYLDTEIDLPPAIIRPGLVVHGGVSVLISRGGKGKTALSLNRLVRWACGRPLHDELPDVNVPADGPVKTLIIENEGSPGHFQRILGRIVNADGVFTSEQIELIRENIYIWGDGGWSGLKVDDPKNMALISKALAETECDILFLEPFRGLWTGNENDATEMSIALDAISAVANEHQIGVMITHHERKGAPGEGGDAMDAARGSSVFEGHCGVMERWRPVKGDQYRELSWLKARFDEKPAPVRMEFDRERWGYDFVPESQGERTVLQFLSQHSSTYFSAADVHRETEEPYHKVQKWLKALEADGKIRHQASGGRVGYIYHDGTAEDIDDDVPI